MKLFEQCFFFGWLLQERFCRYVVYVKKRMLEKKYVWKNEKIWEKSIKNEKKKWNEIGEGEDWKAKRE